MRFNYLALLPNLLFSIISVESKFWYPQCFGLDQKMYECCGIFSIGHLSENREICAMECLQGDAEPCCFDECFAEKSGIYVNNTFHREALIDSITRGRVDPETTEITEISLIKCECAVNQNLTTETCGIPEHVYRLTQCVLTHNYFNCPNVSKNEECKEFSAALDPCRPITTSTTTTTTTPRPTPPPTQGPTQKSTPPPTKAQNGTQPNQNSTTNASNTTQATNTTQPSNSTEHSNSTQPEGGKAQNTTASASNVTSPATNKPQNTTKSDGNATEPATEPTHNSTTNSSNSKQPTTSKPTNEPNSSNSTDINHSNSVETAADPPRNSSSTQPSSITPENAHGNVINATEPTTSAPQEPSTNSNHTSSNNSTKSSR